MALWVQVERQPATLLLTIEIETFTLPPVLACVQQRFVLTLLALGAGAGVVLGRLGQSDAGRHFTVGQGAP